MSICPSVCSLLLGLFFCCLFFFLALIPYLYPSIRFFFLLLRFEQSCHLYTPPLHIKGFFRYKNLPTLLPPTWPRQTCSGVFKCTRHGTSPSPHPSGGQSTTVCIAGQNSLTSTIRTCPRKLRTRRTGCWLSLKSTATTSSTSE